MLTRVDPPLDGAVVLLEHVIQIRHWPMPAILGESAFGFELRDGGRIRGVAVGVDHPRRGMVRTAQRFNEKALGCDRVLLSREEKIQGRSAPVHRPVADVISYTPNNLTDKPIEFVQGSIVFKDLLGQKIQLLAMGYGGSEENSGRIVGQSGDGGKTACRRRFERALQRAFLR